MGGKGVSWKTILKIWKENAENMIDPFTAERMKSAYCPLYANYISPKLTNSYHNPAIYDNCNRNYSYINEEVPVYSGYVSDGSIYNQHEVSYNNSNYFRNINTDVQCSKTNKKKQHHHNNQYERNQDAYYSDSPSYQISEQNIYNVSNLQLRPVSEPVLDSPSVNKPRKSRKSTSASSPESVKSGFTSETDPFDKNDKQLDEESKQSFIEDNSSATFSENFLKSDSFHRISEEVAKLLPPPPPPPKPKKGVKPMSNNPPEYLDCSTRTVCGCNKKSCYDSVYGKAPTKEEIKESIQKMKCSCGHTIKQEDNEKKKLVSDLVNVETKLRSLIYRPNKTTIQKIYNNHLSNKYENEKKKIIREYTEKKRKKYKKHQKDCQFTCCKEPPPGQKNKCALRRCDQRCKDFVVEEDYKLISVDPFFDVTEDEKVKKCRRKKCKEQTDSSICKRGKAGKSCKTKYPNKLLCERPCNVHKVKENNGFIDYLPTEKSCNDDDLKEDDEDLEEELLKKLRNYNSDIKIMKISESSSSSCDSYDSDDEDDECDSDCCDDCN